MGRWVLSRLLRTAFGVWVIASAVFLLSRHAGTRPQDLPDATDLSGRSTGTVVARRAARTAMQQRLGLDLPLFYASRNGSTWQWHGAQNQYHAWLQRAVRGDWGRSFRTGQPVAGRLLAALAYTGPLTGTALLLAVAAALALGQRLAARPWWHRPVRAALTALQALPLFVVAVGLLLVFANPELLDWFPAYGLGPDSPSDAGWWFQVGQYAARAVLPIASLVLVALPGLTLQLEAGLALELRAPYATTARAKGLPEALVVRRHALRNALLPLITQLTDLLPALVAGAVVVEVVFAVPGMGRLLAEAAATRDFPVLVGAVALSGSARLLAQVLADVFYQWADPRIRWQR